MLAWRLGLSALIIPLLFGIFYLDVKAGTKAYYLLGLAMLLAWRSTIELVDMFRGRFPRLQLPLLTLCVSVIVAAGWLIHWRLPGTTFDLTPITVAFALSFLLICASEALRFRAPGGIVETLGASTFIIGYAGLLLALTAQLRWIAGPQTGYVALGSLLVCVKGGDIGAYTFGRLFGRKKMAPALSPGKTWEGGYGAVVVAALCSWLWFRFAAPYLIPGAQPGELTAILFYGALLGVIGALGDLCESLLKRDVGVKDSGKFLPGFGGLLDLLDSVLYGGPVALVLWKLLPLLQLEK
ncbi:phosphatidate cytidylyltransferase [Planctomicrobium sp. SH664]|uniref:phosphatidate cytidylyltransferase n=1 Tax=Planctomicrobium sp. SH664 TaxID=3448125 RepID=UPI003F5B31D4